MANENTDAPTAENPPAEQEQSKWPDPIPEEWKTGRAANAESWFQKARDETLR